MHWTEQYIGLAWELHGNNCVDFMVRVAREHDEVPLAVPAYNTKDPMPDLQAFLQSQWALYTAPIDTPRDGDLVFLSIIDGDGAKWWHCGRFTLINGREYLLHSLRGAKSHLTPMDKIGMAGMKVEGFYQWRN